MAQSAVTVEYADCIFVEGEDSPNEYPGYDTKQSEGEAPVKLELWRMRSSSSSPLFPCLLWPGVVIPDIGL